MGARLHALAALASSLAGLALAVAYLSWGPSVCLADLEPLAATGAGEPPGGAPLAIPSPGEDLTPCEAVAELGWIELPLLGRLHLSQVALAYFAVQAVVAGAWALGASQARLAGLALYAAGAAAIPYLAYLQYAVAEGFCSYCTGMYACIAAGLASCAAARG